MFSASSGGAFLSFLRIISMFVFLFGIGTVPGRASATKGDSDAPSSAESTVDVPRTNPPDGEDSETASLNRFRIDSVLTIREDGKSEGIKIETTTLFSKGAVIDFIGDNDEIIIYNRVRKNFILLDPIHRIQTELTIADIDLFLSNLRKSISEKEDKFYQFILHPEFDISRNDESGELFFQSKWFEYRILTRSFADPVLCGDYFEFSEVYSKLNIYLNPGTFTPMARMKINETLQGEKRFPAQIALTFYPNGKRLFAKSVEIKSEHKMIRRLSEEDHGRIVRANHFSRQFPKMTFGNYYKTVTEKVSKE